MSTGTNRSVAWAITWRALAVFAAVAVIVAIIGAVWGFRVVTAPVKGKGDAAITKYSAENWTEAQARFENEYQDVVATDQKIQVVGRAAAADPKDRTKADTLTGLKSYCLSAVADYNADARKYLSSDFRAADLPEQIDMTNPKTDCKETK